ncbi:hypothetical protein SNEBB_007946 [Seison nebaliae]|nr:hypothetical protein SNEBB_007946 [Seison nebaliae]
MLSKKVLQIGSNAVVKRTFMANYESGPPLRNLSRATRYGAWALMGIAFFGPPYWIISHFPEYRKRD